MLRMQSKLYLLPTLLGMYMLCMRCMLYMLCVHSLLHVLFHVGVRCVMHAVMVRNNAVMCAAHALIM